MANQIGCLVIDLEGKKLTAEERELLNHPLVGGVILFSRNYETRLQLSDLCHSIRAARSQPILIMVDQEGGRVQRFIAEFTELPAMGKIGQLFEKNQRQAHELAKTCGWLIAAELLSLSIDLSLAPVLDLDKGLSNVIGQRAFHQDPEIVISLAKSFVSGMKEAGMASAGKHFPGHGSVVIDSHISLPIDNRSLEELMQSDLIPFINLIQTGLTAIMVAHIVFPQIDPLPASFSPYWITAILRNRLGFAGPILTDDLNMEGANISTHYGDRVLAAREAGCDFTLLCNNRSGVIQTLDVVPHDKNLVDYDKWVVLQGEFRYKSTSLSLDKKWQTAQKVLNQ